MRSVIFKVFGRKSPFDGLVEHAEKVSIGARKFKEAIEAYFQKDYDKFEILSNEVMRIENEADNIKGNTRNHLHKGIYMPVDRGDFLSCLKEQDAILDACEDAVIWLQFRNSEIDDNMKKHIEEYVLKIISMVENLEVMVKDVHRWISSASLMERKAIKSKIRNIHYEESEIDQMGRELIKKFFSSGEEMLYIYHLIHVIFILGKVADHAENVGDRIRVMMA